MDRHGVRKGSRSGFGNWGLAIGNWELGKDE